MDDPADEASSDAVGGAVLDPAGARVLLVDHHDSFTGNLVQLLWCLTGRAPVVVLHDDPAASDLDLSGFTHLVLGPGPGTPHDAGDLGCALDVLGRTAVPALGVCFGFQVMSLALGGAVVRAPAPAHGVVEVITASGGLLLGGPPGRVEVVRYHSLALSEPSPTGWRVTARADDGVVMGAECPELGLYGVQFHPESIGTPLGEQVLSRFLSRALPGDPVGRRALVPRPTATGPGAAVGVGVGR